MLEQVQHDEQARPERAMTPNHSVILNPFQDSRAGRATRTAPDLQRGADRHFASWML